MKAQLSLELLLYISLAGLSLAFALGAASGAMVKVGNEIGSFEISQFVNRINTLLLTESSAQFSAYLPRGLCSSSASGSLLATRYGNFYFTQRVNAQAETFCPDGVYAELAISTVNNSTYISRA